MTIPSAKYLKVKAKTRLASGQEPQKVILYYLGITAGLALVVTLLRYFISTQIAKTGGLQNIGTRSILATIDNLLPILQIVVVTCVGLGFTAAMLRIARRQFASPKTLKTGFERFWPLLLSKILQGLIYAAVAFGIFYLATAIYLMTPLSRSFMEQLEPLITSGTLTPESLLQDDALMMSLSYSMTPMFILYAALYLPVIFVISYRFRMADYIIIDQPGCGAMSALRQSRGLMRGNGVKLFLVDLSFWWYHLLRALATAVLYVDTILLMFGVVLPINEFAVSFGIAVAYLATDCVVSYFFMNYHAVTMALAYHSIAPKKEDSGAVLGNIFNL